MPDSIMRDEKMKGRLLSRRYFEECAKEKLEAQFPDLLPYLAAGIAGSGSECFGFDDEISQDHDFEPGFCLFIPGEDVVDRRSAFLLERFYASLPKEYMGFSRSNISPVGGDRRGVIRIGDFFTEKTGSPDGSLTSAQWLQVPEWALAEAVNGELYFDHYGQMSRIRENLAHYPEDIRRKRLAGALLLMAQSGQYNYLRTLRHGQSGAAQLSVVNYVTSLMNAVFLLNRVYQPYYKWSFEAMRRLPRLALLAELCEYLLTTGNDEEMASEKYDVIESMASDIIEELQNQQLTRAICQDLEKHAYSVNDSISDPQIRNMNILAAV